MFHPRRRRRIDPRTGGDRAGQRNLIDPRISDQRAPHGPPALHHVENPGGHPGFDKDLRQLQRAQGGHLRGFEHHRIAHGERRGRFPAGDLAGVVPRPNAHANPQSLADRVDEIAAQGHRLAGHRRREAREIFQRIRARGPIGGKRLLQGLAGVIGFQHREIVQPLADDRRRAVQDAAALDRAQRRPVLLRRAGRGERGLDHRRGSLVQPGNHRAGAGIDHLDDRSGRVFQIGAIDEMAGFRLRGNHCGLRCQGGRKGHSPRGKRWFSSSTFRSMWLRM